jgi:hypothetical protein
METDIRKVGNLDVWSDDPEGWLFRIYSEHPGRQRELEGMGLAVVAIYWLRGRIVGRDYRANKTVLERLLAASPKEAV